MKALAQVNFWILPLIVAMATSVLFAQSNDTPPPSASPLLLTAEEKIRLDFPDFAGRVQQLAKNLQLIELADWLEQLITESAHAA